MNVVSIMAHADDEMRCLGTMLKCKARGDNLAFVTVTDGSGGFVQNPDIERKEAAAIRDREMRALADGCGAGFLNLNELDEFLYDTPETRRGVIEAIRFFRADLIFTHFHEDYNLDHTTVNSLVRHCAIHSCLPMIKTESPPLAAHPAIFMVEPHGPFIFPASHFVDISAQFAEKCRLLPLHESQEVAMTIATGSGLVQLTGRLDGYRGEQVGCAQAEAFVPMQARGAIKTFSVLP